MTNQIGSGADARPGVRCAFCNGVAQYLLNAAIVADLGLNALLGGQPLETLSQRTARARRAGSKPAAAFCAVLTWVFNRFGAKGDHCQWSLEEPGSLGRELWAWSDDTPNPPPPPLER